MENHCCTPEPDRNREDHASGQAIDLARLSTESTFVQDWCTPVGQGGEGEKDLDRCHRFVLPRRGQPDQHRGHDDQCVERRPGPLDMQHVEDHDDGQRIRNSSGDTELVGRIEPQRNDERTPKCREGNQHRVGNAGEDDANHDDQHGRNRRDTDAPEIHPAVRGPCRCEEDGDSDRDERRLPGPRLFGGPKPERDERTGNSDGTDELEFWSDPALTYGRAHEKSRREEQENQASPFQDELRRDLFEPARR